MWDPENKPPVNDPEDDTDDCEDPDFDDIYGI